MKTPTGIPNPKQNRSSLEGTAAWYPYYAGFSEGFAREALSSMGLAAGSRVLDVWNGAGTTTTVARSLGFDATGIDLNPVMVIAARARLLSAREWPSLQPIANDVIGKASCSKLAPSSRDPLCTWLLPEGVAIIRRLEEGIQHLLIGYPIGETEALQISGNALSDIAAFYYVVLFRTVRKLLGAFITSNPTWVKRPKSKEARLGPTERQVCALFADETAKMVAALKEYAPDAELPKCTILLGDSASLPLLNESIDFVLSSPPYCTRIDYAVATLPELAVLRFDPDSSFQDLRRRLIGSTTVPAKVDEPPCEWGKTCRAFLEQLYSHSSKASSTYYYKSHCQYFAGVNSSLKEIVRVLSSDGMCMIVVQDSYYKDIHNDLPAIVGEMLSHLGLKPVGQIEFSARSLMANINPRVRVYRQRARATESVIIFRKD
jgi:DNA modification methylase